MFQEILGVHEAKYPQKSDEPEQVFFDYFKRALPAVDVRPRKFQAISLPRLLVNVYMVYC